MRRSHWILTAIPALFFLLFSSSPAVCSETDPTSNNPTPPFFISSDRTFVFECPDGFAFTVRVEANEAWLFLPGRTVKATAVPSASGAKYVHETILFWNKGDEALLHVDDEIHKGCRNNKSKAIWEDAKLRGVGFRALGNEPGWHLEITAGEEITFVTDYGDTEYAFSTPKPFIDQRTRTTTYAAENSNHTLTVVIEGEKCNDTMSYESFDATVTVTLDNKIHRGCGKALH